MSFTYEWRRDGTPIGTGNTHVVVALDVGTNITCAVTATNALGSTTAVTDNLSIGGPTTGTGAIAAQRSAVIATGTVAGGLVTGTGAIAAQAGHVVGTGSVTGALGVTGIGLLAAQASDVDGAGSATGAGVGLLTAQASDVDGVGAVRSTGTGVLTAQASDVDGVGSVTGAGVGLLVAQQAGVDGVGTAAFTATTTVTAPNGQWWKFNGTHENGVYLDGDPWVKTSTTVQLIEVSTPTIGTGVTARHGGMINPVFYDLAETSPIANSVTVPLRHGYDGRVKQTAGGTPSHALDGAGVNSYVYDAALNAHTSLPRTLSPGDSLVSAVSINPEIDITTFWGSGSNRAAIAKMACVTIVNTTPAADAFRPNYFGPTKINKRFSDCNLTLLPDLTAPYNPKGSWSEAFHLDTASTYVGSSGVAGMTSEDLMNINALRDLQYWVFNIHGTDAISLLKPTFNQYFHSSDGDAAGRIAMYVMCDFADRDHFVKRILQNAIDAYAVAQGAGFVGTAPFGTGAGFYRSPLWFIRFAGLLFNDTAMKNAGTIATGREDFYGNAMYKWGILNRVYLSTTAHAQYKRVLGQDYTAGFPLFGDAPWLNNSAAIGDNGSARDPAHIYDMEDYKCNDGYGGPSPPTHPDANLPHANYPDILDDPAGPVYLNWSPTTGVNAGIEAINMGNYMSDNNPAMMGEVCASIAMGDEAFWPNPAVGPFARRVANDPQMWLMFGVNFDYNDYDDVAHTAQRDVQGFGGTANGWMTDMWEQIVGTPAEPPSDAFEIVTFDGSSDYLLRGADLSTIANGTEFTFVIRCNPIDNASPRVFIADAADNFAVYMNAIGAIVMAAWGAGLYLSFTGTLVDFVNADGMQTLFVSGRTTGTPILHCYKGSTDMLPAGVTTAAGTMDFTSTNWAIGATVGGAAKFAGDVAFVWFDTRYYDVSDPDVRAMWATPALLEADGSGPGFEPKIYMTGDADVWNVGTNQALGGNFVMSGAVSDTGGDTTAPVLSSAVATATGAITASLQVSTNEGNGTLYWVVTYSTTPPTAAQVKLGQTNTGAAAPDSGSQAVSGTGVQTVSGGAAGLTAATACFAYFMHEDASTNQSTVVADGFTTDTVDTTAPVLSSPVATDTSANTASLTVTTDEANGTIYWVVTLSATPPSKAQIKAGQDHASAAAPDSGSQAVSGTGAQSITGGASGLSASTAYFAYFMHEDASTNQSNVVTDGFTTSASSATTIFSVTLADNDHGNENFAYRVYVAITGGAGATSKVRCTFEASSAAALDIDNASIGIYNETTPLNCTATPVELLFGGTSGYVFTAGESKTSDWVTLGGFTSSSHLLVTIDVGSTNGAMRHASGLGSGVYTEFLAATNWYNAQNATGPGGLSGQTFALRMIEVM